MFSLLVSLALAGESSPRYHYKGPENVCFCDVETIAAAIQKAPEGKHRVWAEGWGAWKDWSQVPEIVAAVGHPGGGWSYAMNGGAVETLSASDIAARVAANPNAQHLVWKEGMEQWQSPQAVPELAETMRSAAPTPDAGSRAAPPPLPPMQEAPPMPPPDMERTPPAVPVAPDRSQEPPRPDPGVRREAAPMEREGDLHIGPMVSVGADTRVDIEWDHLQDAFLYEDFSIPTFRLERFIPHISATIAPWASAEASLFVSQRDVVVAAYSELDTVGAVEDGATSLSIAPNDLYVDLHGGKKIRHHARIGVAAPIFGGAEGWEEGWRFGALDTWHAAVVAAGLVPYRDVGFSYGFGGEKWDIAGQVQNGNGTGDLDVNEGKDLSGRIAVRPVEALGIEASALYGPRALYSDASLLLGHVAVDFHTKALRGRAEAWFGNDSQGDLDAQPFGFNLAAGGTLWVKAGALSHLDVEGRFLYTDPDFVDAASGEFNEAGTWTYSYAVAVNGGWRVAPHHDLYTGLVFTSEVPELVDDPVSYGIALQQGWRF